MGRSNISKMSKDFVKILLFYVGWTCYILPAWQFESNSNESSSTDFFKNLLDIMGCSIMVVGSRALQTRQKSVTGGKLVCPHNKPRFDFSPLCVVSNAALFPAITS